MSELGFDFLPGEGGEKWERIWVRNLTHTSDPSWDLLPLVLCLGTRPKERHWNSSGTSIGGHRGAAGVYSESGAP